MDDLEALTDLWVELATDQRASGSHICADSNREPIRESIGRHIIGDQMRVAREAEQTVGLVMFRVESESIEQTVTRGLIENIYVVPDRRREGIGSALLAAGEAALSKAGVDVIALDVLAANENARAFYDHHGYSPHRITVEKSIENDTPSRDDE